jgi:hypothetical protein
VGKLVDFASVSALSGKGAHLMHFTTGEHSGKHSRQDESSLPRSSALPVTQQRLPSLRHARGYTFNWEAGQDSPLLPRYLGPEDKCQVRSCADSHQRRIAVGTLLRGACSGGRAISTSEPAKSADRQMPRLLSGRCASPSEARN